MNKIVHFSTELSSKRNKALEDLADTVVGLLSVVRVTVPPVVFYSLHIPSVEHTVICTAAEEEDFIAMENIRREVMIQPFCAPGLCLCVFW